MGMQWARRLDLATVVVLVGCIFLLCSLKDVGGTGRKRREVLESAPASVLELEKEAKKDVENDATNAGLAALQNSKSGLTASLTGGLKRDLQNMKEGDDALLKHIESASARGSRGSRGRTVLAQD